LTWVITRAPLSRDFFQARWGDKDSLDKAARQARIEAVEVLARRMDTYMDTTGRKKERGENRHPEIIASTAT